VAPASHEVYELDVYVRLVMAYISEMAIHVPYSHSHDAIHIKLGIIIFVQCEFMIVEESL
jgi:hypothetical protein